MSTVLSLTTAFFLFLAFATHIFGLPANWLIIAIIWAWDLATPHLTLPLTTYLAFIGAAAFGECVEFALQAYGARKYGASRSGNWGAIAGAIGGAIFGAPFLFGLGALLGAVGGAYCGCLMVEVLKERPLHEAKRAAWGAMVGKVLGMAVKIGIGIIVMAHALPLLF